MPWDRRREIKIESHPELLKKTTKLSKLWSIYEEKTKGIYSKHTLDSRKKAVNRLISETKVNHITMIDSDLLNRFKNTLIDRGRVEVTINSYLSSINCFLQFFGLDIEIPYVTDRRGREVKILKSLLKPEEVERLLEIIPDPKYKAAVALFYYTGIRAGKDSGKEGYPMEGLLGLNWGDINFEDGTFTITGKGGKRYVRPLPEIAEKYLRDLKETGNMGKTGPDDPVFLSKCGTRLCYMSLYLTLRKYMKKARITKEKRHPHAFRHTRGTIATMEHGIRAAQGILCHDNLASTLIYEHISDEEYLKELIRPDKVKKVNKEVKMKRCPRCGLEITPDRKLCDCGYDFTLNRCPKCGQNVVKDAKFCSNCGSRIGIPKPECICGYELRSDFRICPNCGRATEEVKRLWDEKSFEKWSALCDNSGSRETKDNIAASKLNAEPKLFENKVDVTDCDLATDLKLNNGYHKHYQVQVASDKEQLIKLVEDGWELLKEIPPGEFILRRLHTIHGNS
jgi:integrase